MSKTTSKQLRFPTISGMSVRAAFDGGAMSSGFGALLLAGVDRQMGLTDRLAASFNDRRHPSYVNHVLANLLKQRIYQQACAYEDGNDVLKADPMFKIDVRVVQYKDRIKLHLPSSCPMKYLCWSSPALRTPKAGLRLCRVT